MFVKPAAGRQVADPDRGGSLPPEGRAVPRSQYWLRRLADGDVIPAAPAASTTEAAPPKAAKSKEA